MRFLQYVCKMPIKAMWRCKVTKTFSTAIICSVKSSKVREKTAYYDGFYLRFTIKKGTLCECQVFLSQFFEQ